MNRKSKQLHIINKLKKTSKYENKVWTTKYILKITKET
jgi:hypothetical protein